jgi:hypothetical protein
VGQWNALAQAPLASFLFHFSPVCPHALSPLLFCRPSSLSSSGFDEMLTHIHDRRVQRIDPHHSGTNEETFALLKSIADT